MPHLRRADSPRLPRAAWLQRLWAVFILALLAATWPLWTPQEAFPQVPLVRLAATLPKWLDWAAMAGMMGAALLALAGARWRGAARASGAMFVIAFVVAALLNQHRLQPWAWQFALLGLLFSAGDDRRTLAFARALTLSVYLFSALSKLDATFLSGLGQQLLDGLLQSVGGSLAPWPAGARWLGALALPLGEALAGVLLIQRRLWPWGLAISILMHAALLLALGPLGLGHKPGVLLWNAFFIAQNVTLFGAWKEHSQAASAPAKPPNWTRRAVEGTVIAAMAAPLLEPAGLWDHWLGWALYAPHASRVDVYVHEVAAERLPEEVRRHLTAEGADDQWLRLRIDRWSLDAVAAPIYPQARFQLGVAQAVSERHDVGSWIRAAASSPASRFTGRRQSHWLYGREEIRRAADAYWLNTQPRAP